MATPRQNLINEAVRLLNHEYKPWITTGKNALRYAAEEFDENSPEIYYFENSSDLAFSMAGRVVERKAQEYRLMDTGQQHGPDPAPIPEPPPTDEDTQPFEPVCSDCNGTGRISHSVGQHTACASWRTRVAATLATRCLRPCVTQALHLRRITTQQLKP